MKYILLHSGGDGKPIEFKSLGQAMLCAEDGIGEINWIQDTNSFGETILIDTTTDYGYVICFEREPGDE